MRKNTVIRALAAALVLAVVVSASGCSQKPASGSDTGDKTESGSKPLKIGYLPITHSAPLMLADAEGVSGAGVELVKFGSWPELTDALNAGRIDGGVTMLEIAYASAAKGVPLKLIALSHRNGDAITVASDIDSISELKGQRVAVPHRLSGQNLLLKLALEAEGLTLDDVTRVEMAPADMPAALARGELKGYTVAEPFGTLGVANAGGKALVRAPELWEDWLCCGLVVREDITTERGDDVQALVDAFVRAGRSVAGNQSDAAKTASAYTKYDQAVWEKSFELGVDYGDLVPRADELARLEALLAEEKLLEGDVDIDALLDDSFVTKAVAQQ